MANRLFSFRQGSKHHKLGLSVSLSGLHEETGFKDLLSKFGVEEIEVSDYELILSPRIPSEKIEAFAKELIEFTCSDRRSIDYADQNLIQFLDYTTKQPKLLASS